MRPAGHGLERRAAYLIRARMSCGPRPHRPRAAKQPARAASCAKTARNFPKEHFCRPAVVAWALPSERASEQPPYAARRAERRTSVSEQCRQSRRSTPCFSKRRRRCLRRLLTQPCSAPRLIGSSAYAADNPPAPANPPAQTQAPSGVNFVTSQEKSQWRAPKLIGVGVYGSDDKQIGKIDDLLLDKNGSAQTIVIGVGGFLGFGKKDVAVPFSAMQWRTEVRKVPATDQPTPIDRDKRTTAAADEGNGPGGYRGEPGLSRQGDPQRDLG